MTNNQVNRLTDGGVIDRNAPIQFYFDGKLYSGFKGDTLASALLANDVHLVGRSFKYHRPRGIFSAGSEEPNAMVELRDGPRVEPNTRATVTELFDGLEAKSQNRWPSLAFDILGINGLISPLLVAGFYYKTFKWPGNTKAWLFYEKFIRRAAGLGSGTHDPDPDTYDRMNAHADVLVIGGGPSGIAAALSAGRTGARVILMEENNRLGGRLLDDRDEVDGQSAGDWLAAAEAELADLDNVQILTRCSAFGYYDGDTIGGIEKVTDHLAVPSEFQVRQRYWRVRARKVVLATGALERSMVFPGNDRPGVMLASAVRTYINRYGVRPGHTAVVLTNNDDGYNTAFDLHDTGAKVQAIVDLRHNPPATVLDKAGALGIEVLANSAVLATHGRLRVTAVDVATLSPDGENVASIPKTITCDLLAVAGGWNPVVHLHSQDGGRPEYDDDLKTFVPGSGFRGNQVSIGACAGQADNDTAIADGLNAGAAAAIACGYSSDHSETTVSRQAPSEIRALWRIPQSFNTKQKRFVDLQNDVTAEDVALAHREGYISVEHLKRYTTLGMGTDQGKTSNIHGLAIMAEERGCEISEVGTTAFRPPYQPVTIGALAGRDIGKNLSAVRRTPMHHWHAENGAKFVEAGQWMRAQYYLAKGEDDRKEFMDRAISDEVKAVRNRVGLVDVSTLGKIDIQGPDAGEFLNRVYINGWKALPVGKARYGIMLRDDGLVLDDGTTSRLGENHYFMTTTTAEAGPVMSQLETLLQVDWPDLDVRIASVTEQWAAIAIAGPKSREVLEKVVTDLDVSNEGLPYLGVRTGHIAEVPCRIFRISFSGELAYEVNVAADWGTHVWEALMEAGAPMKIRPYGTEALGILRIEKGHIAGPEIDGRTTADDIGLGRMASSKKPYIGLRMMDRDAFNDEMRPKLVGLRPVDWKSKIRAGAILLKGLHPEIPAEKLGHVSSSAYLSPTVKHPIALGFVSGGMARAGQKLWAMYPVSEKPVEVEVVDPVFFDKEGERLHG